jgi:hypothetical protein
MSIALLKRKTAENVHCVCQKIQLAISARTGNKLLTWQFDRGTEFLNSTFERWLKMELGVIQRFSNVEHHTPGRTASPNDRSRPYFLCHALF